VGFEFVSFSVSNFSVSDLPPWFLVLLPSLLHFLVSQILLPALPFGTPVSWWFYAPVLSLLSFCLPHVHTVIHLIQIHFSLPSSLYHRFSLLLLLVVVVRVLSLGVSSCKPTVVLRLIFAVELYGGSCFKD
jgi:hypothetical protein